MSGEGAARSVNKMDLAGIAKSTLPGAVLVMIGLYATRSMSFDPTTAYLIATFAMIFVVGGVSYALLKGYYGTTEVSA